MNRTRNSGRRGELFMLLVDIIFLIALILIFWKVTEAFQPTNPDEGLGTRQTAVLNTYAMSEQMLLYLDETARFAALDALSKTADKGSKTGTALPGACGTYAGYELWTNGRTTCIPDQKAETIEAYKKLYDAQLRQSITFPGFPPLRDYETTIREQEGKLIITATTDDRVRLPILAAKGVTQATITRLLQRQNLIASQQGTFNTDSLVPGVKTAHTGNRRAREGTTEYLIITSTQTQDLAEAVAKYTSETSQSVHYLIDYDGTVLQLVPENDRAASIECTDATPCSVRGTTDNDLPDESISIALVSPPPTGKERCAEGSHVLSRTRWCGGNTYKGTKDATCTGAAYEPACFHKYTKTQLDTLKTLSADILRRREIKSENILLEEQTRYASPGAGPALREDLRKPQQEWLLAWRAGVNAAAGTPPPSPQAAPAQPVRQDTTISVQWPTTRERISSCKGPRTLQGKADEHGGIDIPGTTSDPVYAAADGIVILAQECDDKCTEAGQYIIIKHSGTFFTQYNHLSDVDVDGGDRVTRGQVIGKIGNTGHSTGAHLDFKVYTSDPTTARPRTPIDPLCVYPEDVLRTKQFSQGSNCLETHGPKPTHTSEKLTQACNGVTSHASPPACNINAREASLSGNDELSHTLRNIGPADSDVHRAIVQSANENGIDPRLLIAVITQESTGLPNLVSDSGCAGLAQFCLGTAGESPYKEIFGPGLQKCSCPAGRRCTAEEAGCANDPRMDPKKSAKAMGALLRAKWSYKRFEGKTDRVLFAIASYNGGEGLIGAAIEKTGKPDPSWAEVAEQITPQLILENYCENGRKTNCYWTGEERRAEKVKQIRDYVAKVGGHYAAQGGSVGSAYADQTCEGISVKEMGSYLFTPSFKVEVPNGIGAAQGAAKFASQVMSACKDDTLACLEQQKRSLSGELKAQECSIANDGTNNQGERVIESFAEAVRDCRDNLQYVCTCSWTPPVVLKGKLTIEIHQNAEFEMFLDDQRLTADPTTINAAASAKGGLYQYRSNEDAEHDDAIKDAAGITYTFVSEDGKRWNEQYLDVWIRDGGKIVDHQPIERVVIYKPDETYIARKDADITWLQDPEGLSECGAYKTMARVCLATKDKVYSKTKGTQVTPIMRFALDLRDTTPPASVTQLAIAPPVMRIPLPPDAVGQARARAEGLVAQARPGATELSVMFLQSESKDISYYLVRCAKSTDKDFGASFDYVYARHANTPTGAAKIGLLAAELTACGYLDEPVSANCVIVGNEPPLSPGNCYKVSVTPVDLAGNEGDPVIVDQALAASPQGDMSIANAATQ